MATWQRMNPRSMGVPRFEIALEKAMMMMMMMMMMISDDQQKEHFIPNEEL